MTLLLQQELSEPGTRLLPFTVEQYHEMIATGILEEGEPYELLNGQIVRKDRSAQGEDPMTVGDDHTFAVMKLNRLNPKLERLGCHFRPQQPVILPPHDEPEPDGAIVRGTVDDYVGRKPAVADILCVIEVADSSLRRDRTIKLRIYADAGIRQYVIVNLPDRVVEVYTQPMLKKGRYANLTTLTPRETLTLPTPKAKGLAMAVSQLFAPARRGRPTRNGGRH